MEENDLPFKGKKKIPCILAVGSRASRDLLTNFHGSTAKKQVT